MVLSRIAARQVLARRSNLCLSASTSPWTTPSYRHNSASSSLTRPCPGCSTPLPLPASPCPKCSHLVRIPQGLSHHSMLNLSSPVQSSSSSSPSSSPSESDSKSSTETDGFVFDIPLELSKLPSHGFDLDPKDLRRRMLDRQKDLHPDKFSNQGEKMVELARELSGRVNEAYAVLGDPLKRAEYILGVHNLSHDESDSLTDPTLLAEILEAREELESAQTQEEVDHLRAANHEKVQTAISQIRDAFNEEPPNLAGAKILTIQLKYWMGLEAAAKEWGPSIAL